MDATESIFKACLRFSINLFTQPLNFFRLCLIGSIVYLAMLLLESHFLIFLMIIIVVLLLMYMYIVEKDTTPVQAIRKDIIDEIYNESHKSDGEGENDETESDGEEERENNEAES
jgi:hypothetical protein